MSLKTTIDVPVGKDTARCTIKVPLQAITVTSDEAQIDAEDPRVAKFAASVTAAVIKAIGEESATSAGSEKEVPLVELAGPNQETVTIFVTTAREKTKCILDKNACLYQFVDLYARRLRTSSAELAFWYNGRAMLRFKTPLEVRQFFL
jgi:hypothetical protein